MEEIEREFMSLSDYRNKERFIMKEKTKNRLINWAKGLVSAALGGASTSVGVMLAEPATFNIGDGLGSLVKVCGVSAVVAMAAYLKKSPLFPTTNAKGDVIK